MLSARRALTGCFDGVLDMFQDVSSSLGWAEKMNGAMVPVSAAEHVKMTLKSGKVPEDLSGVYLRVGPNAQHWPPKKRTHAFDGDGMVHSVRIRPGGDASYHCRFMETPRYIFEKEMGSEWFLRVGEMQGIAGLLKIMTTGKKKAKLSGLEEDEMGTANTAIGFTPDGKLWALNESSAPFRFTLDEAGVPHSVGFDHLQGTLKESISAHPKFDQRTGEILFHGRKLPTSFYAGRIAEGKLVERVDIDMPVGGFHHDMCITENYMVMIDGAMAFTPQEAIKGKQLWTFQEDKKLRFGIFHRSKKLTQDALVWIEADVAAEIVHTCYAYDEGDEIVLWTPLCYYNEKSQGAILGGLGPSHMHRVVIDVAAKKVKIEEVEGAREHCTEFPRIRDDRVGKKVRYGYSGMQVAEGDFDFRGLLKWDFVERKLCGVINYPQGVVGGEPVFLPKASGQDDEGYIALLLWNEKTSESTFAVYDGQSFSAVPLCEWTVHRRVPLGFHAAWITEAQFQQQLPKY